MTAFRMPEQSTLYQYAFLLLLALAAAVLLVLWQVAPLLGHTFFEVLGLIGAPAALVVQIGFWFSKGTGETYMQKLWRQWGWLSITAALLISWGVSDYFRSLS